jgi:hypothetical protein
MMSALVTLALVLGAAGYDETFNNACKAYNTGDYKAAIEGYEQLVSESVVNPAVFFNLGNAYYRAGAMGPAIANYERALQLDPAFDGARENLSKAVNGTKNRLARPAPPAWRESLLFWHYQLSRHATNVLASLFWILVCGVAAFREWRPWKYANRVCVIFLIFAVAFGASALAKAYPGLMAVANADTAHVHYGTNENETVRFDMNAGDRVMVDRRSGGWSRVTTQNGERGWARDSDLVFVGPPYERPTLLASSPAPSGSPAASPDGVKGPKSPETTPNK